MSVQQQLRLPPNTGGQSLPVARARKCVGSHPCVQERKALAPATTPNAKRLIEKSRSRARPGTVLTAPRGSIPLILPTTLCGWPWDYLRFTDRETEVGRDALPGPVTQRVSGSGLPPDLQPAGRKTECPKPRLVAVLTADQDLASTRGGRKKEHPSRLCTPNPHVPLPLRTPLILHVPERPLHGSLKPVPLLWASFPGVPLLVAQERHFGCLQPRSRQSHGFPQAVPVPVPGSLGLRFFT